MVSKGGSADVDAHDETLKRGERERAWEKVNGRTIHSTAAALVHAIVLTHLTSTLEALLDRRWVIGAEVTFAVAVAAAAAVALLSAKQPRANSCISSNHLNCNNDNSTSADIHTWTHCLFPCSLLKEPVHFLSISISLWAWMFMSLSLFSAIDSERLWHL